MRIWGVDPSLMCRQEKTMTCTHGASGWTKCPKCRVEWNRKWRSKNREWTNSYNRHYRTRETSRFNAYSRDYRVAHKEAVSAISQKYRENRIDRAGGACVYVLLFGGMIYVGETNCLPRRLNRHRYDIQQRKHACKELQAWCDANGWKSIKTRKLEDLDEYRDDDLFLHSKLLREKAERKWKAVLIDQGYKVVGTKGFEKE